MTLSPDILGQLAIGIAGFFAAWSLIGLRSDVQKLRDEVTKLQIAMGVLQATTNKGQVHT